MMACRREFRYHTGDENFRAVTGKQGHENTI
jgi:hypothetical protein